MIKQSNSCQCTTVEETLYNSLHCFQQKILYIHLGFYFGFCGCGVVGYIRFTTT